MHILIKNKNLYVNHYRVKCAIGKRGIGIKKREGDKITPKGKFKIKLIFYRKDRVKNLKTYIKKKAITKSMGWCNDPKSKNYNKLIMFPSRYNAEKLYRKNNIYDIIVVLDFNSNPVRKGKGSAIFLHISKRNYRSTEGCVAINKKDMKYVLKFIKKNTIIVIN